MKDVRFYLEYESPRHKRRGEHTGNIVAVFPSTFDYYRCLDGLVGCMEGIAAMYGDMTNSYVASTAVHQDYLAKRCKRVPEKFARQVHPRLFERLDMEESA
jgi:hypothetical protein